jgi:hypothetical protein
MLKPVQVYFKVYGKTEEAVGRSEGSVERCGWPGGAGAQVAALTSGLLNGSSGLPEQLYHLFAANYRKTLHVSPGYSPGVDFAISSAQ